MLPLALALSLAAPVPKAAPFPLRTDTLPEEYKLADLEDTALPRGVKGTVAVLAWETMEDDSPHTSTHALLLKKLDKADEKGNLYTLTLVYRTPTGADWEHPFIRVPPRILGEEPRPVSTAYHFGYQKYAESPTDEELATFLRHVSMWTPKPGQQEVITWFPRGKQVITTKLTAGGFDRDAWKKAFDRDPPVDLFPELKTEAK